MSKKDKVKKEIPEGFKCFKKLGGGSMRFPNRIIKSGQKFWIDPNSIPDGFKDVVEETGADYGAVIVFADSGKATPVAKKEVKVATFEKVEALDEAGEVLKKGNNKLYNIVSSDGKVMNETPLRSKKADELLETLQS